MLRVDWLSHTLTEGYWRWLGQTHLFPAAHFLPLPAPQFHLASSFMHLCWLSPHTFIPRWFYSPNYIQPEQNPACVTCSGTFTWSPAQRVGSPGKVTSHVLMKILSNAFFLLPKKKADLTQGREEGICSAMNVYLLFTSEMPMSICAV